MYGNLDSEEELRTVLRRRLPVAGAVLLLAAGCGSQSDNNPLVGTWTASTYRATNNVFGGSYQITATFKADGTEDLYVLTLDNDYGKPDPKPPVESHGTYKVQGRTIVQTLDANYPNC
jgi:hypothetical protein